MSTLEQSKAAHRAPKSIAKPAIQAENQHRQESNAALVSSRVEQAVARTRQWVAPLWSLRDSVAVNPFVGLAGMTFLQARHRLMRVRNCDPLPSKSILQEELRRRHPTTELLKVAIAQCQKEEGGIFDELTLDQVEGAMFELLRGSVDSNVHASKYREIWTVAELTDRQQGTEWSSIIIQEISRFCAAHYDQGQASWANPWSHLSLYAAWKEWGAIDRTIEMNGAAGFRQRVKSLPASPLEAIDALLAELDIESSLIADYLAALAFSINGWASYVKREADDRGINANDDFVGLLAIRLAYDVALSNRTTSLFIATRADSHAEESLNSLQLDTEEALRYVLLTAIELQERKQILAGMCDPVSEFQADDAEVTGRLDAQLVFCIDVRSEVLRRHLEATSSAVKTYGFAGFFGVALEHQALGESNSTAQCPVLLKPALTVQERAAEGLAATEAAKQSRWLLRTSRKVRKSFQSGATSCFTYVESLGLGYLVKLFTDAWQVTRPVALARHDGIAASDSRTLLPVLSSCCSHTDDLNRQVGLAETILRNLGLTRDFARLVVLCGHSSEVVNNPLKAGLDCGACGGHSGEVNARIVADLLQDSQVREGLAERGISIPKDTRFVAGLHVTTTDEVKLFTTADQTAEHGADLFRLEQRLKQASEAARQERASRLGLRNPDKIAQRSRDWSEVRPEWALAGNRAFIAAPRESTTQLNLRGRAFLHSYDNSQDESGKVLELILTAPVVVASWINLQYFASVVDQQAWGSGDKTTHNVIGQLGVVQGNGGDLMTGLAWQSLHDGKQWQHTPLRLSVIVRADRDQIEQVLGKHESVRNLCTNGWLNLIAIEQSEAYRWSRSGAWEWTGEIASHCSANLRNRSMNESTSTTECFTRAT